MEPEYIVWATIQIRVLRLAVLAFYLESKTAFLPGSAPKLVCHMRREQSFGSKKYIEFFAVEIFKQDTFIWHSILFFCANVFCLWAFTFGRDVVVTAQEDVLCATSFEGLSSGYTRRPFFLQQYRQYTDHIDMSSSSSLLSDFWENISGVIRNYYLESPFFSLDPLRRLICAQGRYQLC